jgi:hypothetical protein
MGIEEIVSRAIPAETCVLKEEAAKHRRQQLKQRIEELLRDQSQPYHPPMQYKNESSIPGTIPQISAK